GPGDVLARPLPVRADRLPDRAEGGVAGTLGMTEVRGQRTVEAGKRPCLYCSLSSDLCLFGDGRAVAAGRFGAADAGQEVAGAGAAVEGVVGAVRGLVGRV